MKGDNWLSPSVGELLGFRAVLLVAGTALAVMLWNVVCTVPGLPWNAARLAPSFAIASGHPIYALRDAGAQLGWFYGPVFPLWYLPVTLTPNPTVALVLAAMVNTATVIVPVLLIVHCSGAAQARNTLAVATIFYAALLLGNSTYRGMFYFVHVDAVCVALGLLACAALHQFLRARRTRALHAVALCLVLACWTKQTAVMLAPGMLLWLWIEGHARSILPFILWCAIYTLGTASMAFVVFGGEQLVFNLVWIHARNPFQQGSGLFWGLIGRVLSSAWIWIPAAICCGITRWRGRGRSPVPSDAHSLIRLLLWVSIVHLPFGLIAGMKAGGGVNSVHSIHYAGVAGLVLIVYMLGQPAAIFGGARRASMAWGAALLIPILSGLWLTEKSNVAWKIYRGHERLITMVRETPGRYYFPWNPLVTLIGERRVYPFDDALYCLWLCELAVPIESVRAAVPANPIIVYEEPVQSKFALQYFPELLKNE